MQKAEREAGADLRAVYAFVGMLGIFSRERRPVTMVFDRSEVGGGIRPRCPLIVTNRLWATCDGSLNCRWGRQWKEEGREATVRARGHSLFLPWPSPPPAPSPPPRPHLTRRQHDLSPIQRQEMMISSSSFPPSLSCPPLRLPDYYCDLLWRERERERERGREGGREGGGASAWHCHAKSRENKRLAVRPSVGHSAGERERAC